MGQALTHPIELVRSQQKRGSAASLGISECQGWRMDHEDAHFCCIGEDSGGKEVKVDVQQLLEMQQNQNLSMNQNSSLSNQNSNSLILKDKDSSQDSKDTESTSSSSSSINPTLILSLPQPTNLSPNNTIIGSGNPNPSHSGDSLGRKSVIQLSNSNRNDWSICGILDGHGGKTAAKLGAKILPGKMRKALKGRTARDGVHVQRMVKAFVDCDEEIRSSMGKSDVSGSTIVSCGWKRDEKSGLYSCFIANAGDSRALIVKVRRKGDPDPPTYQSVEAKRHTPNDSEDESNDKSETVTTPTSGAVVAVTSNTKDVITKTTKSVIHIANRAWRSRKPSANPSSSSKEPGSQSPTYSPTLSPSTSVTSNSNQNSTNLDQTDIILDIISSEDHKPDCPGESKRIKAAGGYVSGETASQTSLSDCPRLDGNLAVSRGFGDFQYKSNSSLEPGAQKVSCVPEIYEMNDVEPGNLILLGCDGIFDVMTNEELVQYVFKELMRLENQSYTNVPTNPINQVTQSQTQTSAGKGSGLSVSNTSLKTGKSLDRMISEHEEEMKEKEKKSDSQQDQDLSLSKDKESLDNCTDLDSNNSEKGGNSRSPSPSSGSAVATSVGGNLLKAAAGSSTQTKLSIPPPVPVYPKDEILGQVAESVIRYCLELNSRDNMTFCIIQLGQTDKFTMRSGGPFKSLHEKGTCIMDDEEREQREAQKNKYLEQQRNYLKEKGVEIPAEENQMLAIEVSTGPSSQKENQDVPTVGSAATAVSSAVQSVNSETDGTAGGKKKKKKKNKGASDSVTDDITTACFSATASSSSNMTTNNNIAGQNTSTSNTLSITDDHLNNSSNPSSSSSSALIHFTERYTLPKSLQQLKLKLEEDKTITHYKKFLDAIVQEDNLDPGKDIPQNVKKILKYFPENHGMNEGGWHVKYNKNKDKDGSDSTSGGGGNSNSIKDRLEKLKEKNNRIKKNFNLNEQNSKDSDSTKSSTSEGTSGTNSKKKKNKKNRSSTESTTKSNNFADLIHETDEAGNNDDDNIDIDDDESAVSEIASRLLEARPGLMDILNQPEAWELAAMENNQNSGGDVTIEDVTDNDNSSENRSNNNTGSGKYSLANDSVTNGSDSDRKTTGTVSSIGSKSKAGGGSNEYEGENEGEDGEEKEKEEESVTNSSSSTVEKDSAKTVESSVTTSSTGGPGTTSTSGSKKKKKK